MIINDDSDVHYSIIFVVLKVNHERMLRFWGIHSSAVMHATFSVKF